MRTPLSNRTQACGTGPRPPIRAAAHRIHSPPMDELPPCPECESTYTYRDGALLVCPECAHEWNPDDAAVEAPVEAQRVWRDANGAELKDGDSVTLVKDLKVKGAGATLKAGTKVRNIRLVEGDHDIDCRIDGIGPMSLKSAFVKKA